MAKLYYEKDADLGPLKGKTVAVVGYGIQGRAQALNLHDRGGGVVGARRGGGEAGSPGGSGPRCTRGTSRRTWRRVRPWPSRTGSTSVSGRSSRRRTST